MEKIDWTKPIEIYNGEFSAMLCHLRENDNEFWPFKAYCSALKQDFYVNKERCCVNNGASTGDWRIRNVTEATDVELAVNIDEGFATLRDQFAMAVITGLADCDEEYLAERAYTIADAMLEARNK